MISKTAILSTAERLDAWLPSLPRQPIQGRRRLAVLLVHSVFAHAEEATQFGVYPHEQMTVERLRQLVERFLEMGYAFISTSDLQRGSDLPAKPMVLTFDDGYFNFMRALPILSEYQIPATLFVSPYYIANTQSFWWDAFHRHARRGGSGPREILREMSRLRTKSFADLHQYLTDHFGKDALRTETDVDRPLTLDEFREVARHPLVHLGNHTFHHTALPFRSQEEIQSEILLTEEFFVRELGSVPKIISYPNGDHSDLVFAICEQLGYSLGWTIEACSNPWTSAGDESPHLALGRYMLSGDRDVNRQAHSIDCSFSIAGTIRRFKKHKFD